MLEVLEKRQQLVVWFESPDRGAYLRRFLERIFLERIFLERIFLERKVRVKIVLRSFDRLVSQPQSDHGAIHTGLQKLHRRGVPQHMWSYSLLAQ